MPAPGWALKTGATALTLLATLGSAAFVSAHLKPAAAPLHPPVAGVHATPSPGQLVIKASVRTANLSAVTSTYAS